MANFENRCADIRAKINRLSGEDEISLEDLLAFNDAVSSLMGDVIEEAKKPVNPNRKLPRWARGRYKYKPKATPQFAKPTVVPAASSATPVPTASAATEEAEKKTKANNLRNLIAFLIAIQGILATLGEIAKSAPQLANFPAPNEILEKLTKAYEEHVVPMVQTLEANADKYENIAVVAGLGAKVFASCKKMHEYREKMDTNEKIYAVLGTVLMFAGIGMLIAATINPTTMPIVAAITVVTLGCYLAQRSIQRHENEESKSLKTSLKDVHASINAVSNKFEVSKAVSDTLMFSAAKACGVTENAPPAPTWVERLSATFDGIANRFF